MKRFKKCNWSVNVLILALSSVFTLFLLELGLRLYLYKSFSLPTKHFGRSQPHPKLGLRLIPNKTYYIQTPDFSIKGNTNSKGFRDVEHDYNAKNDVFRIVMLGDSFMEAFQVELEKILPRRFEKALAEKNVEVINLGVSGYGTTQELFMLEIAGVKYKPDLVILSFFPFNDLRNNSKELEKALWKSENQMRVFGRPYARIDSENDTLEFNLPDIKRIRNWAAASQSMEKKKSYLKKTVIVSKIKRLQNQWKNGKSTFYDYDPNIMFGPLLNEFIPEYANNAILQTEYQRMWDTSWQVTERLIQKIKSIARTHNADFLLLVVPSKEQVDEAYYQEIKKQYPKIKFDITKPNRKIAKFAKKGNILFIDLLPAFQKAYRLKGAHLYFEQDRHWNANGHSLATIELVNFIIENKLVSK